MGGRMNTMVINTPVLRALFGAVAIMAWLTACQITREPDCTLPSGTNVELAFDQARDELSRKACQPRFDDYFTQLLDIAAGSPSPEHGQRFSEFLLWANEQGAITKRSAEDYYNRYFSPKFASLQNDYSNCTHTCRLKAEIESAMQDELLQKDIGLLKVMNNKRKYAQANTNYRSVLTLIEATCEACRASP